MAGFKKGNDPKRGRGRPPGTKNKTTAQIKDCFRQIIETKGEQTLGFTINYTDDEGNNDK